MKEFFDFNNNNVFTKGILSIDILISELSVLIYLNQNIYAYLLILGATSPIFYVIIKNKHFLLFDKKFTYYIFLMSLVVLFVYLV
ncbi:MAG: hypothetical protein ACP5M9_01790 [Candidatus Micrarchaeia archaeon]